MDSVLFLLCLQIIPSQCLKHNRVSVMRSGNTGRKGKREERKKESWGPESKVEREEKWKVLKCGKGAQLPGMSRELTDPPVSFIPSADTSWNREPLSLLRDEDSGLQECPCFQGSPRLDDVGLGFECRPARSPDLCSCSDPVLPLIAPAVMGQRRRGHGITLCFPTALIKSSRSNLSCCSLPKPSCAPG